MTHDTKYLSVAAAAVRLGVTAPSLYRWLQEEPAALDAVKIGGRIRIPIEAVEGADAAADAVA